MRALLVVAIAAASGALALAGCGSGDGETTPAPSPGTGGGAKAISLSATEYSFDPGSIRIDEPGTYTFTLTNDGATEHALEIEGQDVEEETDELSPGDTGQLTITFSKVGTFDFYCPVDDHRARGMEGTLTVGQAAMGGGAGTTEDNGGDTGEGDTSKKGGYGY
ncbi:MAG TPA: cupredoxin domain-containing protein [Gaiellaceae bacterium]|nr:cupredoxin domain-containing protein [Gaiellaceae bacterium]